MEIIAYLIEKKDKKPLSLHQRESLIQNHVSFPIKIEYHDKGKPYLINAQSQEKALISISISHKDNYEIISFVKQDIPFGVDMENQAKKRNIHDIASYIFSTEIASQIKESYDNQEKLFYFYWTLYESCVKSYEDMHLKKLSHRFKINQLKEGLYSYGAQQCYYLKKSNYSIMFFWENKGEFSHLSLIEKSINDI